MRMHSPGLVELVVVVMCESSMTFSLPLPRKFHQFYDELLIPLNYENKQDRPDLSSTLIFGLNPKKQKRPHASTAITRNSSAFIQNPINYSMSSPMSKQPTQAKVSYSKKSETMLYSSIKSQSQTIQRFGPF